MSRGRGGGPTCDNEGQRNEARKEGKKEEGSKEERGEGREEGKVVVRKGGRKKESNAEREEMEEEWQPVARKTSGRDTYTCVCRNMYMYVCIYIHMLYMYI